METKETTNQRMDGNKHNFYSTFNARFIGKQVLNVTVACSFPPLLTDLLHILALFCKITSRKLFIVI